MTPKFYDVLGNELVIVWDDGHETYFELRHLRHHCPCATCSGEPDLFGRIARPKQPELSEKSFELTGIEKSGRYGLQLNWADGHRFGIWSFDRLRSLCPCDECRSEDAQGASDPSS